MQQGEEQISMVILEARANDLLFMGDEEDNTAATDRLPMLH
jgi:hypothetical protein